VIGLSFAGTTKTTKQIRANQPQQTRMLAAATTTNTKNKTTMAMGKE